MNIYNNVKISVRILVLSLLSSSFLYANAGESPAITGNVKDQNGNLPIGYATVSLHLPVDSSLVAGTVADEAGNFEIIPPGKSNYLLRISFVGYTTEYIQTEWGSSESLDLGIIFLEKENFMLEEARVTGERLKAKSEGSNTVYYMNSSLYKISNSGADLLKQIPGARFDLMKKFYIEGKDNVLIYVNGIERDMDFARQLDPEQVDRVEVNSSPGAEYDASTGAVINLVLKQKKQGVSGHVNAELPTSSSEIYLFPSYNLNYGREKFNIYTSYNGDYSYFDIQNTSIVLIKEQSGSNLSQTIQDVRQK
ncbi:MAG: carboxypeptidase-like regulatory domain-containing protein, partial [Bacteroidales bacterium]